MASVTVLGMGAMGSRMAAALLKAGHEVTIWNRTPDKTAPLVAAGAIAATSPRTAVAYADFAISMARDNEASRQIWLNQTTGALVGLRSGAIAIESAAIAVAWIRELYDACRAQGIAFLDAPVAGSRPQAEAAQLIYFVGGDAAVVAQAESILKAMGGTVHHAGPAGSGAAVKLVVNALLAAQVTAMGELMGPIQRGGMDAAKAWNRLGNAGMQPRRQPPPTAANAMLARNFAPMFPIELLEKDLNYVLGAAKENNSRTPIAQATADVFAEAIGRGYSAGNITGVAQLYLHWALPVSTD